MSKSNEDYYRRCSPYCIRHLPEDGTWVALNRAYLPLNRTRTDVGGYLSDEEYKNLLYEPSSWRVTPKTNSKEDIFLNKDFSAPWLTQKAEKVYIKKREDLDIKF